MHVFHLKTISFQLNIIKLSNLQRADLLVVGTLKNQMRTANFPGGKNLL